MVVAVPRETLVFFEQIDTSRHSTFRHNHNFRMFTQVPPHLPTFRMEHVLVAERVIALQLFNILSTGTPPRTRAHTFDSSSDPVVDRSSRQQ